MSFSSRAAASPLDLTGRVAVVTGGSNGIGAASARLLATSGATVCIGYHSGAERAGQLRTSLPGEGHWTARIALEDSGTSRALADDIARRFGKLDILVNSAGFTRLVPLDDLETMDEALFASILSANVVGQFGIIRALLPLLQKSTDAVVVNVSSIAAFRGKGSNIAYCAAKAALDTLTMSLAQTFGPVRFLCVSPAAVATDFVEGRDRSTFEGFAEMTPLKKVMEAEDIANAVLACVTLLGKATGNRIVVDAGMHL